jgi:Fe-S cluster biogenesis protein NfuA
MAVSRDEINKILDEKVNPILAAHYGAAELSAFDDGVVSVKLTGACGTCPSAQYTVEDVVRTAIMSAAPEVRDVVLDTSVSDDLIEMARRILNKEIN